jgi:hypothetical protein
MADASRSLESSADFTRGGRTPAPDHDATHQARTIRVAEEQKRLVEWAASSGRLTRKVGFPEFAQGGEHGVFFAKAQRRYFKITLPNKHLGYGIALGSFSRGATPAEYLDRWLLQNRLFNDDIQLERIVENGGIPRIVISQPSLTGTHPDQVLIDDLMVGGGYRRLGEGAFYDAESGLLVFDLMPRNVIQTPNGELCPIDPVIQRVTPDFAEFLAEHPETINRAW